MHGSSESCTPDLIVRAANPLDEAIPSTTTIAGQSPGGCLWDTRLRLHVDCAAVMPMRALRGAAERVSALLVVHK